MSPSNRAPISRIVAVAVTLALVLASCEDFTAAAPEGDVVDSLLETGSDVAVPEAGCVFDAAPGDARIGELLCRYQGLLFEALSTGVSLAPSLIDQVQAAIDNHGIDPEGARATVEDVIGQIEEQLVTVIRPLTATVSDLADASFTCLTRAGELLQEALQRRDFGGIPVPGLEDWQATFDTAAAIAASGDLVAATTLVCELNDEMESALIQY